MSCGVWADADRLVQGRSARSCHVRMDTLIHALVLMVCGFECLTALSNPSARIGRILMFAPLGLVHGLVPILAPPEGWQPDDTEWAAWMALLGVGAFAAGWRLYERRRPQSRAGPGIAPALGRRLAEPVVQRALRRMCFASAVLGVVGWLAEMVVDAGSVSAAWNASRFEYRGRGGLLSVVLAHARNTFPLLPGFLCFFLPLRYRVFGIVYTCVMAVLMFVGTQGARGTSLGLLVGLGLGFALRYRLGPGRVLLAGAFGLSLVVLASGLYEARKIMGRTSAAGVVRLLTSPEAYRDMLRRDPLSYHNFLVAAVHHFPDYHPYLNGATYRRLVVFFVPRKYAEWLKPPDTNQVFASVIKGADTETTIPPTMMGDGYINFWGWPGVVLIGLFNGALFAMVTHRARANIVWFLGIGGTFGRVAVMSIRGQPYEIITGLASAALLTVGLGYLVGLPIRAILFQEASAPKRPRKGRGVRRLGG